MEPRKAAYLTLFAIAMLIGAPLFIALGLVVMLAERIGARFDANTGGRAGVCG